MNSDSPTQLQNPITHNIYRDLPSEFYEASIPVASPSPTMIELNRGFLAEEGIVPDWFASEQGLAVLSGNGQYEHAPLAMAYSGHQFGHWVSLLGDGRAHMLGQLHNAAGTSIDVQLKGSGQTPYSRGGDGRATLGSVLREYVISEAMHGLGMPTTRSLAVIGSGQSVMRERPLPGAILVRTAHSHIRVGSFQYAAVSQGEDGVKALADFMLARHFPALDGSEDRYTAFLGAVVERQATLVAQWMLAGFIHGVMNTDNMSIVGETIDYGPCAFMDEFHPEKVFSSIDQHGRYAWNQQPNIALWNLSQFAGTLLPLLATDASEAESKARAQLDAFAPAFQSAFNAGMRKKLGLDQTLGDSDISEFAAVTFGAMAQHEMDFTVFFDSLTQVAAGENPERLLALFNDTVEAENWQSQWSALRSKNPDDIGLMRAVNPAVIARNHRVEEAIEAATERGDFSLFRRLCQAVANPFEVSPNDRDLQDPPSAEQRVTQTFCGT